MKDISELQFRKVLETLEREKISLFSQEDALYPKPLLALPKPPPLLFVQGTLPSSWNHALTIVGTRTATHYGKGQSFELAKIIAMAGSPIVSGLARGIDSAAHEGALAASGITVAVIGSGHCQLYPKENQNLALRICEKGALISEYPPFAPPTRYTFVMRNRLLAALGQATLLIESPEKGGSMITVDIAQTLGRPLFALPATVDMASFKGNFQLIKAGKARLLDQADDLLALFSIKKKNVKTDSSLSLSPEERSLYDHLCGKEKSIEELLLLTQLPIMQLNALLTSLLLQGGVEEFAGKLYKKRAI